MSLKYLLIEKNSVIFHEGDEGDLFYIILKGSVKVLIGENSLRGFKDSAVLTAGSSFGELALIKNKPRSGTVFTLEDTHFAVLSKKDFLRILGTFTNKQFDELTKFLKSLPLFAGWSLSTLFRLNYLFVLVKFKRGQKVFTEGDNAEFVYIVKKGEFEISKDILLKTPVHVVIGHHGRPLKPTKKAPAHLQGKMSIVTVGEIVGDDDVLCRETYSKTCTCYSTSAEVLQIPAGEFKRRIRSEDSLNILAEKQAFRTRHFKSAKRILKEIKSPESMAKSLSERKVEEASKVLGYWNLSTRGSRLLEQSSSFRSWNDSGSEKILTSPGLVAKIKNYWRDPINFPCS
jgi:CRP-like cAMP-binding protein